jgi:hypothetical protein
MVIRRTLRSRRTAPEAGSTDNARARIRAGLRSIKRINISTAILADSGIPAIGPGAARPPVKELWTPGGQ